MQVRSYQTNDKSGWSVSRVVWLCNTCDMAGDKEQPDKDEFSTLYDL